MRYRPQRWPCRLRASLMIKGQEHNVTMVNVSQLGARITAADTGALTRCDDLWLIVAGLRIPARVAWADGGTAGLRFATPIPRKTLARLRVDGAPAEPRARLEASAAGWPGPLVQHRSAGTST